MIVFVLEETLECVRFLLLCNVFVSNMLLFTLEEDLACGGFQMPYKIVVGNVLVFVLDIFNHVTLLLEICLCFL